MKQTEAQKAERLSTFNLFLRQKPEQGEILAQMQTVAGISKGAAVALTLCRDALDDYCPDSERVRVVALLVSLITKGA